MESGYNMSRNDVVMTPLRVKQAIDSRFIKSNEDELNVLINGTWVEFVKVGDEPVLPPVVNCAELLTMYKGDTTLTETPIINATGCTSLYEVFRGCTNLRTVNYIHMPNVTNTSRTFHSCSSLTSVPELNMSNVTNAGSMFYGCSSLTSVPELDTSSMTSASAMFSGCSSLTSVPELNMSNVTNVNNTGSMFYNCSSLTSVTFTGNRVPPYGYRMFNGTPITSGNGYIFVPDNMVDAYKTASGWSNHASVIRGISEKPVEWYDTLGFTEFIKDRELVFTNEVQYTPEEMLDILPFHIKWNGAITNVETGESVISSASISIRVDSEYIRLDSPNFERIVESGDLPDLSEEGFYTFKLWVNTAAYGGYDILVDGYFVLRENDANGVVIGHYPIHCTVESQCYLTSAMVGYYGKPDDGVELTTMRRLREVYSEKHAETLKTYYEDSAIIVSEIERLGMQDYYYGHIKDVVDEIVIHVDNENWSVAEELYLNLYYGLKEELM